MKKIRFFICLFLLVTVQASSQVNSRQVRRGNGTYHPRNITKQNPKQNQSSPKTNNQYAKKENIVIKPKKDIYKERVEKFARTHSGVVATFTDNRYSVYYGKKADYDCCELYCYDAISDSSHKMDLPIEATTGYYTSLWITKNRYIFVLAEYRYADFIRIDTKTNQIKYITDCDSAKRTSNGFILRKISRCTNEYEGISSAEMEFAYIDYYYNEEGICTGHGEEYEM